MLHHSYGIRTFALLSVLALPTTADGQSGNSPYRGGAPDNYCSYRPLSTTYLVQTSAGGIAQPGKWQTHDWLAKEILYPNVRVSATVYNQVVIPPKTQVTVYACGCVQTGGSGKTWKRYVNPSGYKSDEYYHGTIRIPGARSKGLPISPVLGGDFVRIEDLMKAQATGFRWVTTQSLPLALGYEDDGYSDNGYWGHDDGTQDQCKGLNSAAVRVILEAI